MGQVTILTRWVESPGFQHRFLAGETYQRYVAGGPDIVPANVRVGTLVVILTTDEQNALDIWRVRKLVTGPAGEEQSMTVGSIVNPTSFRHTLPIWDLNLLKPLVLVQGPPRRAGVSLPIDGTPYLLPGANILIVRRRQCWYNLVASVATGMNRDTRVILPLVVPVVSLTPWLTGTAEGSV